MKGAIIPPPQNTKLKLNFFWAISSGVGICRSWRDSDTDEDSRGLLKDTNCLTPSCNNEVDDDVDDDNEYEDTILVLTFGSTIMGCCGGGGTTAKFNATVVTVLPCFVDWIAVNPAVVDTKTDTTKRRNELLIVIIISATYVLAVAILTLPQNWTVERVLLLLSAGYVDVVSTNFVWISRSFEPMSRRTNWIASLFLPIALSPYDLYVEWSPWKIFWIPAVTYFIRKLPIIRSGGFWGAVLMSKIMSIEYPTDYFSEFDSTCLWSLAANFDYFSSSRELIPSDGFDSVPTNPKKGLINSTGNATTTTTQATHPPPRQSSIVLH